MLDSEHPVFFAVDTGVSLDHLIACVDHGQLPVGEVELDASEVIWEFWYSALRCYEREVYGRNRCLELFRRGGRIDGAFMK